MPKTAASGPSALSSFQSFQSFFQSFFQSSFQSFSFHSSFHSFFHSSFFSFFLSFQFSLPFFQSSFHSYTKGHTPNKNTQVHPQQSTEDPTGTPTSEWPFSFAFAFFHFRPWRNGRSMPRLVRALSTVPLLAAGKPLAQDKCRSRQLCGSATVRKSASPPVCQSACLHADVSSLAKLHEVWRPGAKPPPLLLWSTNQLSLRHKITKADTINQDPQHA